MSNDLTKDEIAKIAREAGFIIGRSVTTGEPNSPERFAALCRAPLVAEVERLAGRERAIEECAAECLALHANGNYKHDTREDCHDAIRALAASPQEQT